MPSLRLALVFLGAVGAVIVQASTPSQETNGIARRDRIYTICALHQDYHSATDDDTFRTIYEVLGIAQTAGDEAILVAASRLKQQADGFYQLSGTEGQGGGISVADLEPGHVLMPMAAVLLDKRSRRVYDTVFVPALHKPTWLGFRQNKAQFKRLCSEVLK
ncbi:hypothetical protein QBC39DRAFT_365412 [Podospora conica]|nr:hypothetical protein QBC39DRAFT_365412 [Schizothecium conicum]